jgi:hypothetical protein
MRALLSRNLARLAVVGILLFAGQALYGCEILDPSQLQASYTLASNTLGVLWVTGHYDDGVDPPNDYYFSGFVIGIKRDASGNVLKTYIAMAMHTAAGVPGAVVTGAGSGNVYSKNGLILTNLQQEYVSPYWNRNQPDNTPGDVAIYSSTTPVPDSWVHQLAPLNAIPYPGFDQQINGVATSFGYGTPSTPNGTLTPTGNPMAFAGNLSTSLPSNVEWDENYLSIQMYPYNEPYLNGAANSRDSGSMVLNSSNQIIGMTVAVTGGPTDLDRDTVFDNFMAAAYHNQVAPYAGIIVTPPMLQFQTSGPNLVLTWNGPNVLQAATNVAGPYLDVTNAPNPYTNALTAPQQFFRLRSTP